MVCDGLMQGCMICTSSSFSIRIKMCTKNEAKVGRLGQCSEQNSAHALSCSSLVVPAECTGPL